MSLLERNLQTDFSVVEASVLKVILHKLINDLTKKYPRLRASVLIDESFELVGHKTLFAQVDLLQHMVERILRTSVASMKNTGFLQLRLSSEWDSSLRTHVVLIEILDSAESMGGTVSKSADHIVNHLAQSAHLALGSSGAELWMDFKYPGHHFGLVLNTKDDNLETQHSRSLS